jgi:hypothetical protein
MKVPKLRALGLWLSPRASACAYCRRGTIRLASLGRERGRLALLALGRRGGSCRMFIRRSGSLWRGRVLNDLVPLFRLSIFSISRLFAYWQVKSD